MPSLKEEYGAITEPIWDLEYGVLNLRDTLQKYIDLLCPDANYTVVASSTKDLVYECVCHLNTHTIEHSPRVHLAGSFAPLRLAQAFSPDSKEARK